MQARTPCLPLNRGRRPVRQDRSQSHSPPPSSRPLLRLPPSWASIVQGDAHAAAPPAISRQDFLALYERCITSGLRSRIVFRHQAGSHEISISCRLSAPPTDAHASAAERRRRHRCKRAVAAAGPTPPPPDLAPPPSSHDPPPSPAVVASPPAKRTRKATRRRCEAELLREPISQDFSTAPSPEFASPFSPPDLAPVSAASRHRSAEDDQALFVTPTAPTTLSPERSPILETSPVPALATSPSTPPPPTQTAT